MFDRNPPDPKRSGLPSCGTPQKSLKQGLLQERLSLAPHEAETLLNELHLAVAQALGVPETAVKSDLEFRGGEMDFVYTVHRQNVPFGRGKT